MPSPIESPLPDGPEQRRLRSTDRQDSHIEGEWSKQLQKVRRIEKRIPELPESRLKSLLGQMAFISLDGDDPVLIKVLPEDVAVMEAILGECSFLKKFGAGPVRPKGSMTRTVDTEPSNTAHYSALAGDHVLCLRIVRPTAAEILDAITAATDQLLEADERESIARVESSLEKN